MVKPLENLRKIKGRSWSEIRTRGGQAISIYAEQAGLSGNLPSDEELLQLIDHPGIDLNGKESRTLLEKFLRNSEFSFFPSLREDENIFEGFKEKFGGTVTKSILSKADNIIEGKFDLLGYEKLDFGADVDWHYEPISGKRPPLKHWKQFDELSTEETGDTKVIWELNRHQHFFTLGVAYGLTRDEKYANTFANHLNSWMDSNPPGMGINWFSSLEVSFRIISWVWAFNLFRNSESLTPELFQRALKFVYSHARHIEKYLSTYYSPNTHLTGEALGLYYLGTQFPFFKQSAKWRQRGEEILFEELDRQILSDGGYFELTTWYHRYSIDFYVQFMILKSFSSKKDVKFLQEKLVKKLQSLMSFLMQITRPDGTTPLIGDDDGGLCLPHGHSRSDDFLACLSTGAVLFDRRDYKFVAGELAEETFWLLGVDGIEIFDGIKPKLPKKNSIGFEKSGYFVMRDGWRSTDNYLLVDCGALGGSSSGHGHADALAIDLVVGGKSMLMDAGTYTYHESEEIRNEFRSTSAHNTLEIDKTSQSEPGGKFSWKSKAESKLRKWISHPRFNFFEGNHNGYHRLRAPAGHRRSILFLKNDYWIMRDFVKTPGTHQYNLNFNFSPGAFPKIEVAENCGSFVDNYSSGGVGVRIFTFGDNGAWETSKTSMSTKFGSREESKRMSFASKAKGIQEFFTFMLPYDNSDSKPEAFETEVANGRAFAIRNGQYIDLLVFGDGESIVRTEFFDSNFRWLWARMNLDDELPEEFVLIGGKYFSFDGREILNHPKVLNFATARRFGKQFNLRTSDSVISTSLSKKS